MKEDKVLVWDAYESAKREVDYRIKNWQEFYSEKPSEDKVREDVENGMFWDDEIDSFLDELGNLLTEMCPNGIWCVIRGSNCMALKIPSGRKGAEKLLDEITGDMNFFAAYVSKTDDYLQIVLDMDYSINSKYFYCYPSKYSEGEIESLIYEVDCIIDAYNKYKEGEYDKETLFDEVISVAEQLGVKLNPNSYPKVWINKLIRAFDLDKNRNNLLIPLVYSGELLGDVIIESLKDMELMGYHIEDLDLK